MVRDIIWPNAWDQHLTEYNFRTSFRNLAKNIGKEIKTKDIIKIRYPKEEVYQQYYDSSGSVKRVVDALDRTTEFIGDQIGVSINELGDIISSDIKSLEQRVIEVGEGIKDSINNVVISVEDLRSDFEYYMGETICILQSVHERLKKPMQTQAEEFKDWGIYCLNNDLLEEAIENFEKSKGVYSLDPITYKFLGHLYSSEQGLVNLPKALDNFQKAARYSGPISGRLQSECFYFEGFTLASIGKMDEAIDATKQALSVNPLNSEAHYQIAAINAQLRKPDLVIENLSKAIAANKGYFRKVLTDPIFDPVRVYVNDYFKELVETYREKGNAALINARKKIGEMNSWHTTDYAKENTEKAMEIIDRASSTLKESRDIIDCQHSIVRANIAVSIAEQAIRLNQERFRDRIKTDKEKMEDVLGVFENYLVLNTSSIRQTISQADSIDDLVNYDTKKKKHDLFEKAYSEIKGTLTYMVDEWEKIKSKCENETKELEKRFEEIQFGDRTNFIGLVVHPGPLESKKKCFVYYAEGGEHKIGHQSAYKIKVVSEGYWKRKFYRKFYLCGACSRKYFGTNRGISDKYLSDFINASIYCPPGITDFEKYLKWYIINFPQLYPNINGKLRSVGGFSAREGIAITSIKGTIFEHLVERFSLSSLGERLAQVNRLNI